MFGDTVATGSHAWAPNSGALPGGASAEDAPPVEGYGESLEGGSLDLTGNDINVADQEIVRSGKDKGKGKLAPRKTVGKKMSSQIEKLCESMSSPRKAVSTIVFPLARYRVEEAIAALRPLQNEVPKRSSIYYFALDLFHEQIKREIFLSLDPEDRFWWLDKEYEKHQASARFQSLLATPSCGVQLQPTHRTTPP